MWWPSTRMRTPPSSTWPTWGIVGDVAKVLPLMIEEIRQRKAGVTFLKADPEGSSSPWGAGPSVFWGCLLGESVISSNGSQRASKIIGKRRKIRWTYADEVPTRAVSFPQGTGLAPPGFPCKQGRPGGARLSVPKYGRFRRGERPGMKPGRFAAARLFWSLPRCILTTGGETHETESDPGGAAAAAGAPGYVRPAGRTDPDPPRRPGGAAG